MKNLNYNCREWLKTIPKWISLVKCMAVSYSKNNKVKKIILNHHLPSSMKHQNCTADRSSNKCEIKSKIIQSFYTIILANSFLNSSLSFFTLAITLIDASCRYKLAANSYLFYFKLFLKSVS